VLKEGDKAPSFDLDSDTAGRVSLRDFADKTLVLFFYPRDSTPGCTRECQAFTTTKRAIEAAGATVIGVSRDSLKSHEKFREKFSLGITLLSDPDLKVHKAYGAWGEKTMYGKKVEGVLRSTFIVGPDGAIARVFPNVKVDGHVDQVLAALGAGGAAPSAKPAAKKPAAKRAAKKVPAKRAAKKSAAKAPAKKIAAKKRASKK
jgi:peroxiredoxin Q/BCP